MVGLAVGAVGSIVGGIASASGASNAADTAAQSQAATNALTKQMYDTTRSDLMPYQMAGQQGLSDLQGQMPGLTAPFSMTQANLEQTPGYQFNLTQGLKSVNNAMGARGLFNSGAVMKGASQYATGLANSTYMDQFNMDQTQKQNTYNRLMGVASLGEDAAAKTGNAGLQASATSAQANATAAGQIGAAQLSAGNAIGGIGTSLGNLGYGNSLLQSMYGGGGGQFAGANIPSGATYGNYMNFGG